MGPEQAPTNLVVVGTSEFLKSNTRMKNSQSVDPHSPSTELESKGVEEETAKNLHHGSRCIAILLILWEERGQPDHPVLPHWHLQYRSKNNEENVILFLTVNIYLKSKKTQEERRNVVKFRCKMNTSIPIECHAWQLTQNCKIPDCMTNKPWQQDNRRRLRCRGGDAVYTASRTRTSWWKI